MIPSRENRLEAKSEMVDRANQTAGSGSNAITFRFQLGGVTASNEGDICCSDQGCQIFLGSKYQNGKNIPNY
jgi:hypothetical protein